MNIKPIKDVEGVIAKAYKILPTDLHCDFLKAISELENNNNHKHGQFPHTHLHKVEGYKNYSVYRAYIHKTKGWRIHLQYGNDNFLILNDILTGKEHDKTTDVIKTRKNNYNKKK